MSSINQGGPEPLADSIRVKFQRGSLLAIIVGLLLTGSVALCALGYLFMPDKFAVGQVGAIERVIGSVIAIIFGILFLIFFVSLFSLRSRRELVLDAWGLHWYEQGKHEAVSWQELRGVGIGWNRPRDLDLDLTDLIKRNHALELYALTGEFESRHKLFTRFRVEEAPPYNHLPPVRYRIILPPFSRAVSSVQQAAERFCGHLWLGSYRRAWHRLPGK